MSSKPNIILIGIDTLRYDHINSSGYSRKTTPNLETLAASGAVFKNCYSQAPNTTPSFMSVMTSLYPTFHGVTDIMNPLRGKGYRTYSLAPKTKTLAQILKQDGYHTAAFTDGANLYNKIGFDRGFDFYDMNLKIHDFQNDIFPDPIPKEEIFYWLNEFHKEPFFLFFHTFAVHNPWGVPKKYANMFGALADDELSGMISNKGAERQAGGISTYNRVAGALESDEKLSISSYEALYDGAINYVDNFIGELFSQLDKLKIFENSLIIVMSDHGEEFKDHGQFGHKQLYNEVLHVPLIIKLPGENKPYSIEQNVRLIDIMPTALDAAGIKTDIRIQGVSLLNSLNKNLNLTAIAENEIIGYSSQNTEYKYIYPRKNDYAYRVDELYDMNEDPKEKNNIALTNLSETERMFLLFGEELKKTNPELPDRGLLHILKSENYWPK